MARCTRPFMSKQGFPCPCGKCENCMARRASQWSFRIMKEAQNIGSGLFITLTYDNENCPMQYFDNKKYRETGEISYVKTQKPTVDITHLQKFIKRLRKAHKGKKIKYYAVSEYGGESWRPHYHAIIMGIDLEIFLSADELLQVKLGRLKLDGKSEFHVDTWKKGHVTIGELNVKTVGYTLKYISKGRKIPQFKGDRRQKEKSVMSKGLGDSYMTKEMINIHRNDTERQYAVTFEGKKIPLPRYFKDRLYDSLERQMMSEIMAKKHIQEIEEMGEKERELYYQKRLKAVSEPTHKNEYGVKNKI